jgi:hypothetical protein
VSKKPSTVKEQDMSHNAPVHEVRSGLVKAAIWRNETGDHAWYSVTLSRLYQQDGNWRDSKSFGLGDLARVAEVADLAMQWIGLQADDAAAPGRGTPEPEEGTTVAEPEEAPAAQA